MAKLFLDAQVFQTPALHRGMGKYSFELIKALSIQNPRSQWDSIELIVSSEFPLDSTIESELSVFEIVNINRLPLAQNDILNPETTSKANRAVIDEFIKETDEGGTYVILSLMQGELSSTFPTSRGISRAVLFYDLIPLIFHKTYLQNPITRKEYLSKLRELFMADIFLAISKTVANDLSIFLGIDTAKIVSIDGGPIKHDSKTDLVDIDKPFILMPTGNDLRKNNNRAIEGFEIFNRKYDYKYSLVITSFFKEEQIQELSGLSKNLIFTGNISGAKLNYLYDNADLLLFPSEYEGLGLPVLEALEHNLKVACSDITVFREISLKSFAFFDPMLAYSIAEGLERAVKSTFDIADANKILNKYTWENSAILMNNALSKNIPTQTTKSGSVNIVGSDYSGNSFVSKFILQSHAEISRNYNVSYYEAYSTKAVERRINFIPYIAEFYQLSREQAIFANNSHVNIYHLSNKSEDSLVLLNALSVPGILMLHDMTLFNTWLQALKDGLISRERYQLEAQINDLHLQFKDSWIVSVLSVQKVVVVFSKINYKNILAIKEKLNLSFKVSLFSLPSNKLVYPEIIASNKNSTDVEELLNLDDVYYESKLSKSKIELVSGYGDVSSEEHLLKIEYGKYNNVEQTGYGVFVTETSNLIEMDK